MEKIVGEFDKCDECQSLVDVYIEFYSKRGDVVKVCMNCIAGAITKAGSAKQAPNETPCSICGYPEYKHSAITHEFDPML